MAAQPNIKDGLWEIPMKMEMDGMPGGGRPPQTMQHCVTPKDVQDPAAMNRSMDKSSRCEVTEYKMQAVKRGRESFFSPPCQLEEKRLPTPFHSRDPGPDC